MKKNLGLMSILLVLAFFVSMLTACNAGTKNATPDEVTTTAAAETTTEAIETTTAAPAATAPSTSKPQNQTSGGSSGGSGHSGGNSSGGNSSGGSTQKPTNPGTNVNGEPVGPAPTKCTVTVGSKGYTVELGETFTYVCKLKTPKKIEDIQATLTYDSTMLELIDVEFPVMGDAPIYNTNLYNEIKFNAINLRGFDFTKENDLVTVEFKVIKKGGTAIATAIEVMSEVGTGNAYVNNYVFAGGVEVKEIIEK
ncbi:MAG: cohesin domain-containing protein [Oscillospiraceae bacterium]|nr:cohesin domain-containing protein [Oscillospiraceae bacterium]